MHEVIFLVGVKTPVVLSSRQHLDDDEWMTPLMTKITKNVSTLKVIELCHKHFVIHKHQGFIVYITI